MLKKRIRKFLPVVIDLETGGLDYQKNPLLEAAIQLLDFDDNHFILGELTRFHIEPADGLEIDPESLEFTKIDLEHPLRQAVHEKEALSKIKKIFDSQKAYTNAQEQYL